MTLEESGGLGETVFHNIGPHPVCGAERPQQPLKSMRVPSTLWEVLSTIQDGALLISLWIFYMGECYL